MLDLSLWLECHYRESNTLQGKGRKVIPDFLIVFDCQA